MQCAKHPDVTAQRACTRCGDFVCRGCQHPRYPDHCGACGDRLPQGIAWEDPRYGPWPWRFLLTLRDVFGRPEIAFPGPARIGQPMRFVAMCAACIFAANVGVVVAVELVGASWWTLEVDTPFVCGVLLWMPIGFVFLAAFGGLLAGSFATGLVSIGRRRGLGRYGFRAAAYSIGVFAVFLIAGGAVAIATMSVDGLDANITNVTWIALCAAWPPLTGRVFFHAGRGLGLTTGRAIAAASGPTLLCTLPAAYLTHVQLGLLAL